MAYRLYTGFRRLATWSSHGYPIGDIAVKGSLQRIVMVYLLAAACRVQNPSVCWDWILGPDESVATVFFPGFPIIAIVYGGVPVDPPRGLRFRGLGYCAGFRVEGIGFRIEGSGLGLGFRVNCDTPL